MSVDTVILVGRIFGLGAFVDLGIVAVCLLAGMVFWMRHDVRRLNLMLKISKYLLVLFAFLLVLYTWTEWELARLT